MLFLCEAEGQTVYNLKLFVDQFVAWLDAREDDFGEEEETPYNGGSDNGTSANKSKKHKNCFHSSRKKCPIICGLN